MRPTSILRWAAALGFAAVAIGAFGAHGLRNVQPPLTDYQLRIFEKGVHYQFFHVLALFGVGLLARLHSASAALTWSARLFIAGILMFSGSLYLLAFRDVLPFSVAWAGPVTPLGGLCFLGGWAMLFWAAAE